MEFLQAVRRILNEGGILVLGSPGSLAYMSEELEDLNACIYSTLRGVFPYLRPIPGDFNLFLASPSAEVSTLDPSILIRRFRDRALETKLLTDFHIGYKLDERRLDWFLESLREGRINEDFLPLGLAGKICLKNTDRVSRVAGMLYASDLFGAWIGALAVSVVLIPVLGILKVCVLVVVLKLISLVLVIASLSRPLRE